MNTKPFTYLAGQTQFHCERCDFRGKIYYSFPFGKFSKEQLMKDTAEMIGYHATNILPQLNGFQGYDCLSFEFGPV